jgi:AcrR family transcriptional regulator
MRQEQAEETRQKLLDAAKKLFAEKGYNGTPVRSINRSIGMADGLLYHYFPKGKKEMLQVIVQENAVKIISGLQRRPQEFAALPIEEVIELVFQNTVKIFNDNREILNILFRDSEVRELVERDRLLAVIGDRSKWFPTLLKARAEAGEIREMDYDSAATVLSAIMMEHFLVNLTGVGDGHLSDPQKRERLIKYQVDLWKKPQT